MPLGSLGDTKAVLPLTEILGEEDYLLRACTVTSLGKIGDNVAVKALANSLKDDSYFVRVNATNALGTIGDVEALPYLQEALENSNGESHGFEMALKKAIDNISKKSKK